MTARRDILPIFIPHLGCPHACVFCNQKRIAGSLSPACPRDVERAVEEGLPRCQTPPQLAFYGGSFTAIPREEQRALLDAAAPYLARGELSGIRVSTRPDAVGESVLDELWERGVRTIELGAQSMWDDVLALCGRGHRAEDTVLAAERIRARGFSLILQMMTGLPGSDDGRDVETARRLLALRPDGVRIYPTVVIRDTQLYDWWRSGRYREHTVDDAVRVCAKILPLFEAAGIPVIRLGLNPTEELSGGDAVAGAYHPALGELVKSRVMLERVRGLLGTELRGGELWLSVGRGKLSQMLGQKRCNVRALQAEYGFRRVKVTEKAEESGEIEIISVAK